MVLKYKIIFCCLFIVNYVFSQNIDYSNLNNWAAHPYKKDCSDSVPKPLQQGIAADSSIDIFFIHPTSYTNADKKFGQNAVIDDEELNDYTDSRTIKYQASIFNAAGRVFAPRYKQAHISSYYPTNVQEIQSGKQALDAAYETVKQAFEFYLKNWNGNRPIVIASHSQGTTHAKRLVKEFFDGKPLQQKLIAAYLAGIPVEKDWFKNIKPCNKPTQTGCVCSWRTLKEGHLEPYMKREKDTSIIVTNPITWDAEKPIATRFENKGSVLMNFNKIIKDVVGASVANNVLWTEKPHFFGSILLGTKNYHIADYDFYYINIRQNVKQRCDAYLLLNK